MTSMKFTLKDAKVFKYLAQLLNHMTIFRYFANCLQTSESHFRSPIGTFHTLIQLHEIQLSEQKILADMVSEPAFDKASWEKYFGDIGIEPPLPADIAEILIIALVPSGREKSIRDSHACAHS